MGFDVRVCFLLVVILVASPSLQLRRHRRQGVNFGSEVCMTPKNVAGQCMDIKMCPVLLEMLKQKKEPGWREYLRSSQCGVQEGKVYKVCCPNDALRAQDGLDELPDISTCGQSNVFSKRVVNGDPAILGAWPWMVALGYTSSNNPLEWLCGGTLISKRHVLTAAHCLEGIGSRKLTTARVGDLNLDEKVIDGATPIDVPVEKWFVHEEYNAAAHTMDIALVRLRDKVTFTELISPICLPTQSTFTSFRNVQPFVTGWGALGYRKNSTTALQEAQIDISSQEFCKEAYKNIRGATIDDRVICAISSVGVDTCQGDSGGPLMLPKKKKMYVIGVVSYGYKCAEPGYPGIYTKVSLYVDWIKKIMRS